jgi:hypothetical protein
MKKRAGEQTTNNEDKAKKPLIDAINLIIEREGE